MRRKVALKPGQPEKLLIELCHYKQRSNWDCGISCVLMVLRRDAREQFLDNFADVCREEGFNRSTWTIDLCYLLLRFNVTHAFYTVTLGVHPGYRGNPFYDNILSKDETRVNARFRSASASGIHLQRASLGMHFLVDHLTNGPAIVLTNARMLTCEVCKFNKVAYELRRCLPWAPPYQGHYVVLCGYDFGRGRVYYRNPCFSNRVCVMTLESFDQARRSYGTDEDVILVFS